MRVRVGRGAASLAGQSQAGEGQDEQRVASQGKPRKEV
jgi:hypothetical protein